LARGPDGHGTRMTVTDPDVPDPLNDPRTLQADPGAYGQGQDLASTDDDAASTGADELAAGQDAAGEAGAAEATGAGLVEDEAFGAPVVGGAWSETPNT
jgi:hypothetical protein